MLGSLAWMLRSIWQRAGGQERIEYRPDCGWAAAGCTGALIRWACQIGRAAEERGVEKYWNWGAVTAVTFKNNRFSWWWRHFDLWILSRKMCWSQTTSSWLTSDTTLLHTQAWGKCKWKRLYTGYYNRGHVWTIAAPLKNKKLFCIQKKICLCDSVESHVWVTALHCTKCI